MEKVTKLSFRAYTDPAEDIEFMARLKFEMGGKPYKQGIRLLKSETPKQWAAYLRGMAHSMEMVDRQMNGEDVFADLLKKPDNAL